VESPNVMCDSGFQNKRHCDRSTEAVADVGNAGEAFETSTGS